MAGGLDTCPLPCYIQYMTSNASIRNRLALFPFLALATLLISWVLA